MLLVCVKLVLRRGRGEVEQFLILAEVAVNVYSEYLLAFIFCPKSLSYS